MRITNKNKYPISVYNAAVDSMYKPIDDVFRVTELINPPLIRKLTLENWDKLEIDVDDLLQALFGTAFHNFLLSYEPKDGVIFKQRFDIKLSDGRDSDSEQGFKLSGEPDKFTVNSGLVEDYKVTSAWAFVFGRDEWEKQLNLYSYLLQKHGYDVHSLQINAFLKDWTYYQAIKKGNWDYPKKRFITQKIKLWSLSDTEQYINAQVRDHLENGDRECTFEERWERPTQYAVTKVGRKSAVRVLDSEAEAINWIKDNKKGNEKLDIECRLGEQIRCKQYCSVNRFCPYYEGD